jgi:hypothetical protein
MNIPEHFVPLAPVQLVKPNGTVKGYGLGATTDAARGSAILAAQLAAASGDTIHVNADAEVDAPLGKDGVNWVFGGVLLNRDGDVTDALWTDGGSAMSFTITGAGRFTSDGDGAVFTHTDTDVRIECRSLHGVRDGLAVGSADITALASEKISSGGTHDAIFMTDTAGGGTLYVETPLVTGGENGIEIAGDDHTLSGRVGRISDNTATGVVITAGSGVTIELAVDDAIAANGSEALGLETGSGYIDARNIDGPVGNISDVKIIRRNVRTVTVIVTAPDAEVTTGDGKAYVHIPASLNGAVITAVHAGVIAAGTTGTSDVQIARIRSGTPVDVLSTELTIDSGETGSESAATAAVINASNDDLATNDRLRIDVDAVSTTAPEGLIVTLELTL